MCLVNVRVIANGNAKKKLFEIVENVHKHFYITQQNVGSDFIYNSLLPSSQHKRGVDVLQCKDG